MFLKTLPILVALLVFSPLTKADTDLSCIRIRIAMDVGSSSTKMRAGVVDACLHVLLKQIGPAGQEPKGTKVKIAWRKNMKDGVIDSEFIKKSVVALRVALDNFTEEVTKDLNTNPELAPYKPLATGKYDYVGGATAAIRDSKNRPEFLAAERGQGLNIRVLSQVEEGHLGYLGIYGLLGARSDFNPDPALHLSWDIGSTSMQIEGYFPDKGTNQRSWHDFGNELTSNSFTVKLLAALSKDPNVSPNPLLSPTDNIEELLQKAETIVRADPKIKELISNSRNNWLAERTSIPGVTVNGISGSHNGALKVIRTGAGNDSATGYSQEDLKKLLDDLLRSGDESIKTKYVKDKDDQDFVPTTATNILYIYTCMKLFNINRVEVVDVDNALGMLPTSIYWKTVEGRGPAVLGPPNP
jgi:hypothetical protein